MTREPFSVTRSVTRDSIGHRGIELASGRIGAWAGFAWVRVTREAVARNLTTRRPNPSAIKRSPHRDRDAGSVEPDAKWATALPTTEISVTFITINRFQDSSLPLDASCGPAGLA
jgi:hypothetical protein